MALTDSEKVLVRKFCGYPAFGAANVPNWGFRFWGTYGDLEFRMNNMSSDEETQVRTVFLPNLNLLEADIPGVRDNIDTARAAVWYRNPYELRERITLFNYWRRELCDFMGCDYGPRLREQQLRLVV